MPIEVTVYTSSIYRKSISATFNIKISASYTIEDKEYQKYALLTVRNTSSLPQDFTINKGSYVVFDMNGDEFVNRKSHTFCINHGLFGSYYTDEIASITFEVPKESSKQIKLYKTDISRKLNVNSVRITKAVVSEE